MEIMSAPTNQQELHRLEAIIAVSLLAIVDAGIALAEIRSKELYLDEYGTWAAYVLDRWGMSEERARRLIVAAKIAHRDLPPIGGVEKYITNESQIRPLSKLRKGYDRRIAFQSAIQSAGDIPPTAIQVTDAVR